MADSSYQLITYLDADGAPAAGLRVGSDVFPLGEALSGLDGQGSPVRSLLDLLDGWERYVDLLPTAAQRIRERGIAGRQSGQVRLLAPLLYPGAIYCAGANYSDHVLEMARTNNHPPDPDPRDIGVKPWHFLKPSRSAIVGTGATVERPAGSNKLDWEIELVAVIGRTARNVPPARALQHVAGYTIANDLSARDLSRRPQLPEGSPFRFDWTAHKGFDGACPLGPWITPAQQVADPQNLGMKLWVNDVLKQDSNTGHMIFSVAEQIAHLSTLTTLHPGDIVLTGTPAGVGAARGEFLQPGDRVAAEIDGLGRLDTRIGQAG
jgi:2-keto-4-pentenoate hydratase/2-oxohepta-3-ene-1,7-dioic acid hydratase in catechol pathway